MRLWSKYRNHTVSEKFYYHFYLNTSFATLLGIVYLRNKCYFKFSNIMYRKYWLSYCSLVSFFFISTMCLIFSKDDTKELLRRYKFIVNRFYNPDDKYLKE